MKSYFDVFMLGLTLSWGLCLSFCSPVVVPYIGATQKNWLDGLKVSLAFSLSRIAAYITLSVISARLGQYLIQKFYSGQASAIIPLATGGLITLLGIIILLGRSPYFCLCPGGSKFSGQGIREMALLGLLVGFAPCLPLIGLLAYIAFNARGILEAALLGLTFGLGTLISPLLLLGPLTGSLAPLLAKRPAISKIIQRACGLVLIYVGTGMLMKVLG